MHWSLDDCPPLYFQSLQEMKNVRAQSSSSSSSLDFLVHENVGDVAAQLFGTVDDEDDDDSLYFGWIALALILLGNGWTDECHNLITPLSWPDDIHFAHGPSLYETVSPDVQTLATYVHSLV